MKVKELIELLKTCPLDEDVILAKDTEGNGYSPLADLSRDIYQPDSTWSGSLIEYADNRLKGDVDVVTLWPTN